MDSVRVLDDMLQVLHNILLVRRGYSRKSNIKWHCSVVSLLFDEFYQNTRNIDIHEYIVK